MNIAENLTAIAQNVPKVYFSGAEKFGLKGSAEGPLATINNVHPAEHTVNLKLKNKNLVDITKPYRKPTAGYEIIDKTTVRVYGKSGHAGGDIAYRVYAPKGTKLTITFETAIGGEATGKWFIIHPFGATLTSGATWTVSASGYVEIAFCRSGGSGNNKLGWVDIKNLQVEIGATATEYTPYCSDFSGTVVRAKGKNLIDFKKANYYPSGKAEMLDNAVRVYVCAEYSSGIRYDIKAPNGTKLTISFNYETGGDATGIRSVVANGPSQNVVKSGATITVFSENTISLFFARVGGNDDKNGWVDLTDLQVEVGESVTEYEAYQEEKYVAVADGSMKNAVKSISPTINIFSEAKGIFVSAECFLDPVAVTNQLSNALITLGGEI